MVACPEIALTQIRIHETIGVEDGLIQSQVNCIIEDRDGFIWFGTFGGVSRWDGINFNHLRSHDGLGSQDVWALCEAPDGSIFIGTNGGGFSVYRDKELTSFGPADGLSHLTVRAICTAPDGAILLGTDRGVDVFCGGRIDTTGVDPQLRGIIVNDLDVGPDGTIYCASVENGVIIAGSDGTVVLNTDAGLPLNLTRAVHLASDGTLYISVARNGIWTFRQGTLARLTDELRFASDHVETIFEGRDGTLYFGTYDSGVRIYRDGVFDTIDETAGLVDARVWAVAEDRNGLVYFGTWGGVCLFKGDRLVTYDLDPELTTEIVTAIEQDQDGSLYFATVGAQLFRFREGQITSLDLSESPVSRHIWSICETSNSQLYIGTDDHVLVQHAGNFVPLADPEQQLQHSVYAIHESAAGELYFGTYDGLFILEGSRIRRIYGDDDYRSQAINDIAEAPDGTVYLATRRGVFTLRDHTVTLLAEPEFLTDAHIWTIHVRDDGALCIGTNSRGMVLWHNGQARVFDVTTGLTDNTVYGVLEDTVGRLYLSTNRGVNILDLSDGEPLVRQLRHRDGLPSEECVQGAYYRESTGKLWFGTIRGACRYDATADRPPTEAPPVHLTRIRIFEDELLPSVFVQPPQFKHHENYLKIDYVGIHPAAPEEVIYRYRLSGIDRGWVETDQRFVQYTNLGEGDYRFELLAGNEWGMWSQPTDLAFTILPPFWKTWWFILLVVGFCIGGITLFVFYRVRQLRAIDRIRRQIAATLHDDVGSGLSSISILSSVIEQKISSSNHQAISQVVQQIGEISRDLIASTSDLVWMANPKQDSLFDLISRLGAVSADLLHSTGISFDARNLEVLKNVRLNLEYRQHLFLLFKEAINNALKYSRATTVRLEAEKTGQVLRMRLSDDGQGFDINLCEHGSGLTNMRDRARALGGQLEIHSAEGCGTTVEFQGRIH